MKVKRTPDRVLTVDPGLQGTGWAVVERSRSGALKPIACGVLKTARKAAKLDWEQRAHDLTQQLKVVAEDYSVQNVVVEFTEFHGAAHKVMAWKTGDLQRLTFFCGVIWAEFFAMGYYAIMIQTSRWKGQMTKQIVELRVRKHYGPLAMQQLKPHTHMWDALGLSLWYYERL